MNIFGLWNKSSEFPLFLMGKFTVIYNALDYKHVSGMNYVHQPSFYSIGLYLKPFKKPATSFTGSHVYMNKSFSPVNLSFVSLICKP